MTGAPNYPPPASITPNEKLLFPNGSDNEIPAKTSEWPGPGHMPIPEALLLLGMGKRAIAGEPPQEVSVREEGGSC